MRRFFLARGAADFKRLYARDGLIIVRSREIEEKAHARERVGNCPREGKLRLVASRVYKYCGAVADVFV